MADQAVQLLDVGGPQFIKTTLALQAFHWHDTEEDQGFHAEELLLGDLQHAEPLGEQLHPHTVFIHAGHLHPLAVKVGISSMRGEDGAPGATKGEVRNQERARQREILKGGRQLTVAEGEKEGKAAEVRKNE